MVLEEIRMLQAPWIEQIVPRELRPAFRTARVRQSAQIVLTKRADDFAIEFRPIRRDTRFKTAARTTRNLLICQTCAPALDARCEYSALRPRPI